MRSKFNLVTAVALVGSSLLYGNQNCFSVQDDENSNQTSVDVRSAAEETEKQNQNTNQGTSRGGGPGGGGTSSGGGSGPRRRAAMIAKDASKLINQIMSVPDQSIPVALLDKAEAIAIFPRGHSGVVSVRSGSGWGTPVFFRLSDADFMPHIGAQTRDYVLLMMNKEILSRLFKQEFKVESERGVAAGPVGREASAKFYPRGDVGIVSYSRTNGSFSGMALTGVVISPDRDLNRALYPLGELDPFGYSGRGKVPADVRILPDTLARYSRR